MIRDKIQLFFKLSRIRQKTKFAKTDKKFLFDII